MNTHSSLLARTRDEGDKPVAPGLVPSLESSRSSLSLRSSHWDLSALAVASLVTLPPHRHEAILQWRLSTTEYIIVLLLYCVGMLEGSEAEGLSLHISELATTHTSLWGRNSSLVECWARCPAGCSVVGSILLWGDFFCRKKAFSLPVEGIFPFELTWVLSPFSQNSFG